MIRLIRKQRLDRVYRSAFECSKVLGCTCLLGILKHRKYTAYAINPCIHAGFTHSRLVTKPVFCSLYHLQNPFDTIR